MKTYHVRVTAKFETHVWVVVEAKDEEEAAAEAEATARDMDELYTLDDTAYPTSIEATEIGVEE
ncbi:MAG TPA: hypothetical protein VH593_16710 [Ktedonobacteraceae bacterium]